ncbi:MAG: hypothetical protein LBK83_15595 [Treponema sp.]|jgi:hypothetical protein|nr:hypothetical protein [Treponema sp.]
MASKKFSGVEVGKNYKWGFICEHCNKNVEKTGKVVTHLGKYIKSTSYIYMSNAQKEVLYLQARNQLPSECDKLITQWAKGDYPVQVLDAGKCPHCKKYQHWDSSLSNYKSYSKVGNFLKMLISSFGYSCFIAGIIWFIGGLFFQLFESSNWIILSTILLLLFFIIITICRKMHNKKLGENLIQLETKEKTFPRLLNWEDEFHNFINISNPTGR